MNESYLLFINNETSLSNQSLVRFFLSNDLKLSVEKELDKTQGIFPMSFSGSLLKSGIEVSWESSFEIYSITDYPKSDDPLVKNKLQSCNKAFQLTIHNIQDELSLAYLAFYGIQSGGLLFDCTKEEWIISCENLLYSAENQLLASKIINNKTESLNQPTLVEHYYSENEVSLLEKTCDDLIERIRLSQLSATPLSTLNVIINSTDFEQVKDTDTFQQKLVIFLDNHQLDKKAIALLRDKIMPKKKKSSKLYLPIILLTIGLTLSLLIYLSGENIYTFVGCILAVFGFIPCWMICGHLLPRINQEIRLFISGLTAFIIPLIIYIIIDINMLLSYDASEFVLSVAAMSMIQAVFSFVLAIISGIISLIKKYL